MTALQIFAAILAFLFFAAVLFGWLLLVIAYRHEEGNTGDEQPIIHDTHFD